MSGGSMDYLYQKLLDANFRADTVERKAFTDHLKKVAKALHDIEWVDSCDKGSGEENESIRACMEDGVILKYAIDEAKKMRNTLQEEIERAQNSITTEEKS